MNRGLDCWPINAEFSMTAQPRGLHILSVRGASTAQQSRAWALQDSENLRYCEMDIKDAPGLKDPRCCASPLLVALSLLQSLLEITCAASSMAATNWFCSSALCYVRMMVAYAAVEKDTTV